MRVVETGTKGFGEYNEVMVDAGMFTDGSVVRGLAFVKQCVEELNTNNKVYVRMFMKDKHKQMFQANMRNINKEVTTSEHIQGFVNTPVYIEGTVNMYKGSVIVDLLKCETYVDSGLKEKDFSDVIPDLPEQEERFQKHINSILENEKLKYAVDVIQGLKLSAVLKLGTAGSVLSLTGDMLTLCNDVCDDMYMSSIRTKNVDWRTAKLFAILFLGLVTHLDNRRSSKPGLLDNNISSDIIAMNDILTRYNIFNQPGLTTMSKEFFHMYECYTCNMEAKTFMTKVLMESIRMNKKLLDAVYMENAAWAKNIFKFGGVEHIVL